VLVRLIAYYGGKDYAPAHASLQRLTSFLSQPWTVLVRQIIGWAHNLGGCMLFQARIRDADCICFCSSYYPQDIEPVLLCEGVEQQWHGWRLKFVSPSYKSLLLTAFSPAIWQRATSMSVAFRRAGQRFRTFTYVRNALPILLLPSDRRVIALPGEDVYADHHSKLQVFAAFEPQRFRLITSSFSHALDEQL